MTWCSNFRSAKSTLRQKFSNNAFSKLKIRNFCDIRKILSKFRFGQCFILFLSYDFYIGNIIYVMVKRYFTGHSIFISPTNFKVGLVLFKQQYIVLNSIKDVKEANLFLSKKKCFEEKQVNRV